jgi:hypothetical protein
VRLPLHSIFGISIKRSCILRLFTSSGLNFDLSDVRQTTNFTTYHKFATIDTALQNPIMLMTFIFLLHGHIQNTSSPAVLPMLYHGLEFRMFLASGPVYYRVSSILAQSYAPTNHGNIILFILSVISKVKIYS